jgi:hypothetical protein
MQRGKNVLLTALVAGAMALTGGARNSAQAAGLTNTPVGVQVLPGTGMVLVTFGTVPDAVGYNIYRREAADPPTGTAAKVNDKATPYGWFLDDGAGKGLPNGTSFLYSVKAVMKDNSEGPASAEAIGMPQVPTGDGFMLYYFSVTSSPDNPNNPPLPASLTLDTAKDVLTIKSTGDDIWDAQDKGEYLARPVTGDYSITVEVLEKPMANAPNTSNNVKVGPMIRDAILAGARYAFLHTTSGRGVLWERRVDFLGANGGAHGTAGTDDSTTTYPLWLRLTKEGAVITASQSKDGTTFTQEGDETTTEDFGRMPFVTYAGISFIASNSKGSGTIKVKASSIKIQ